MKYAINLVIAISSIFMLWFFMSGGIEKSVVRDVQAQYNITKRSGSTMDTCVHAGMVAAAYLQAKDEAGYQTWKERERWDCTLAGISR